MSSINAFKMRRRLYFAWTDLSDWEGDISRVTFRGKLLSLKDGDWSTSLLSSLLGSAPDGPLFAFPLPANARDLGESPKYTMRIVQFLTKI